MDTEILERISLCEIERRNTNHMPNWVRNECLDQQDKVNT